MKKAETKTNIEIEGIILTEEAIVELKSLQDQDNYGLRANIDAVKDVICWIASQLDVIDEDEIKTAAGMMNSLNFIIKDFNRFRKP